MTDSKNFWSGEPSTAVSGTTNQNTSNTSSSHSHSKFDFRFLIASMIIIVILVLAVILNFNHEETGTGTNKVENTISTDNGDLKINWERYSTYEITVDEPYTITESGTYHVTTDTNVTDNHIIINAGTGVVRLILDSATIKNPAGPAIACYAADDLAIELVGKNTITDGTSYSNDYDEDVLGAIYSKADLTFQGSGTLNLTANYQDGIVGKDDLKISSGTYNITAADDGIRGKDSVYIVAGNFTIDAGGDAIKSTNELDADKGFVLIEDGNFKLTPIAKGIKAINSILIYGGDFTITSTDDSIHSNNYVGIVGGNFTLTSGDDGIHADREFIIENGTVNIKKSYEGIEAQAITISGGDIAIVSSDDGINAGGGADSSATNRPGAGAFDSDENCAITINNGTVYVNASGDGIDSNGYVYFNGGTVIVDGPTDNGNGALDSGISITMNGGTVIAVGSSGMAETLGANSSVYNASVYFSSAQAASTKVTIKNAAGETIIDHTAKKTFSHMAVGTTAFATGETYTIYLDDTEYTSFTISNITTTVGNTSMNQHMMPGMGGQNGRQ